MISKTFPTPHLHLSRISRYLSRSFLFLGRSRRKELYCSFTLQPKDFLKYKYRRRMSNHRSTCIFCKQSILSRDIGQHMIKKHENLIFTPENVKLGLWKDKYFTKPMSLLLDDQYFFFCFADYSCIKNEVMADRHFKGRAEKHKEQILKLREKYPLDPAASPEVSRPAITEKEKLYLYEEFSLLIGVLRTFEKKYKQGITDLDKKSLEIFNKLGLRMDDDSLKALFPTNFPDDEEAKEEASEKEASEKEDSEEEEEEEEEDILPLVTHKPITKEEFIRMTLSEKDLETMSQGMVSGKSQQIEEIEQYRKILTSKPSPVKPPVVPPVPFVSKVKRKPKGVSDVSPPSPPSPPPPSVDEELPAIDYTQPAKPWDLLCRANPHLKTDPERLTYAREIGFPESRIPPEVLHRQTSARIITLPTHPIMPPAPVIPRLVFNTKAIKS